MVFKMAEWGVTEMDCSWEGMSAIRVYATIKFVIMSIWVHYISALKLIL